MNKIILLILTGFSFWLAPLAAQDASPAQVREISVTNNGFLFIPKEISVKKGDTVRITYTNAGGFHDLVIDEFNVGTKQIPKGKSETFEFKADRTGEFEFYCSVGNHRKMGMFGKLIISE